MRTTLTLDPDVAALAERMQRERGQSFKAIVNQALRCGLRTMAAPSSPSASCRTPAVDLGRCLVGSLDDVAEGLAIAEGERFDARQRRRPPPSGPSDKPPRNVKS